MCYFLCCYCLENHLLPVCGVSREVYVVDIKSGSEAREITVALCCWPIRSPVKGAMSGEVILVPAVHQSSRNVLNKQLVQLSRGQVADPGTPFFHRSLRDTTSFNKPIPLRKCLMCAHYWVEACGIFSDTLGVTCKIGKISPNKISLSFTTWNHLLSWANGFGPWPIVSYHRALSLIHSCYLQISCLVKIHLAFLSTSLLLQQLCQGPNCSRCWDPEEIAIWKVYWVKK